jgi:F-type H+-transporting ATPase subunit gamma
MASLRQIRRRIRSVQNTQQITRAMEMVAAAKLKKAQNQLFAAKPYAQKMDELLAHLSATAGDNQHPLFEKRSVQNIAVVIITADKGMCGAYNTNILRTAEKFLNQKTSVNSKLVLVGKRGVGYFQRRKKHEILSSWQDFGGKLNYSIAKDIAQYLTLIFLNKQVDGVYLLSTRFISGMTYRAETTKLLNIEPADVGAQPDHAKASPDKFMVPEKGIDKSSPNQRTKGYDYIFEPEAKSLFDNLLPRSITTKVYLALAEAFTSEHSARMIAMRNATDNADDMINRLTLLRNKLRQASITKELTEIVSGAEALKG